MSNRAAEINAQLEREYASLYTPSKTGTQFGDRTYSYGQQERMKPSAGGQTGSSRDEQGRFAPK